MPTPSTIVITLWDPAGVTGVDITGHVLFSDCSFESQIQAQPGEFSITLKDPDMTLGPFATGSQLTVDIDGIRMYGGYVLQVYQSNFFPVVDTTDLEAVHTRQWRLMGLDWNFLMDKRILRSLSAPAKQIPNIAAGTYDGAIIRSQFPTYFDTDAGFDYATNVQDVHLHTETWAWQTPGSTMRDQLTDLSAFGAFFYFAPDKSLHFEPLQALTPGWGFSDSPAASTSAYGGTWIGFREGSAIEDATGQIDDAFVWGGTGYSNNGKGAVVFARESDAPTIAAHNRWQLAENHVGDSNYASQREVTARANTIISGTAEGTTLAGGRGLLLPEKQASLAWFANNVPRSGGHPVHLMAGALTTIHLWTFSSDGGTTPLILTLPLKQVKLSFPTLKDGDTYVRFDGFFGIQQSDPYWLWDYLLKQSQKPVAGSTTTTTVTITSDPPPAGGSGTPPPPPPVGTFFTGSPLETPDGTNVVFHFPFSYIAGSVSVSLNGLLQRPQVDFFETDPANGAFTMSSPPAADDVMTISCRTAGTVVSAPGQIPGTIDDTGVSDVTDLLEAYLDSLPPGTIIYFNPLGIYRCDRALKLFTVSQVRFEGQGCTIDGSHGTDFTENGSTFYTRGSGLKFHGFNCIGSSPTPGVFRSGEEGQHAFLVDGGDDIEIWGNTSINMYGDFAEINSGATNWSVHDNDVPNTGRNGLSVIFGNTGSFYNNNLPHCGYMPADIEPNLISETCHDIDIYANAIGYWSNLAFATDGSNTGADIYNLKFRNNVFTGSSMRMEVNPDHSARQANVIITGNVSDTPDAGPVIQLWDVDGVIVTGNIQPLSSGSLVADPGCTGATIGPNP